MSRKQGRREPGWQRAALGLGITLLAAGLPLIALLPDPFSSPALAQTVSSGTASSGTSSSGTASPEAEKMIALKQTSQRWIEVNVATQRLIAWEGNRPVYAVIVSTGTDEHPTVPGSFTIQSKHRTARMQGEDYDVPDVPYTMYYYHGYAIHGAYWHRRFGTPMSHGCVNVAVNHAEWLFDWASVGTPVVVHF